ncbi:MAG: hypothetical protein M3O41_00420 [Pseudomonadota bacterium]|nr:hypothetical protein [Pseudomonadota bacterium]
MSLLHKVWRYRAEKWFWIAFTPVAYFLHWVDLVSVVSLLSIYALILTAGGAEQASQAAYEASSESETKP